MFKMAHSNGATMFTTTSPVVARDDIGAGPFILNNDMCFFFGCPPTEARYGRGFTNVIPHLVLTPEAKEEYKFYYKFDGLRMEWKEFIPIFFQAGDDLDPKDLSLMCTLGWKAQADLGDKGIGFIQKGYTRYVVSGLNAAKDCSEELWK